MMMDVITSREGGYRYIKGAAQYSAGVASEPGFGIVRTRFVNPVPLAEGFARIEAHLAKENRPIHALCACELRSPTPLDDAGFRAFNEGYIEPLRKWGLVRNDLNPVARSNVCPAINPPSEACLHSFSYTAMSSDEAAKSFVISGVAEEGEGLCSYQERAIRFGDHSANAIQEKVFWIIGELERRMQALGIDWADLTLAQVYSVYDMPREVAEEIAGRRAASVGLTWHFCSPPISGLDCELDVRGVRNEILV